jgi:hypothetical protein
MPVRHTDFAFAEEGYPHDEYPDEIKPTVGSDRFPFLVPRAKPDPDTLSKPAMLLRDRIAEIPGIGPQQVPEGLLRAGGAADAWPDENVYNFASGRVRSISTEVGEILVVDFWASPLALTHDPNNGRTIADARAKGLPYLEAVRDDAVIGAPVIYVNDAAEFIIGVEETAGALGFASNITDAKDLQDINWIGLQGVHEPTLVAPVRVEDRAGNGTWSLTVQDGNRRLGIQRRCLREAAGLAMSDIEAWADHLIQPDGKRILRDMTAKDVENVRRKAVFKDAKYWRPVSGSPDAIQAWLDSSSVVQRTVIRNSVIPARLVVGYRNTQEGLGGRSAAMEPLHRYIRRTHIKTAAQKEWSSATQAMQVALDAMRRIMVRADTTMGYRMALTRAELDIVYENRTLDWDGTVADDSLHPLRLAAKAIATFVCIGTTAEGDVKKSLIAHSMSTHHTKVREHRAGVAASVAMPILGFAVDDKADYNRARAAVDRASRHPMFVAVKRHPNGETDPWWGYLDRPVDELLAFADKEYDELGTAAAADIPDEKSVGPFGPATRTLLFLATMGQATNPAFRATLTGEQATPWQLTVNGLGGTRGATLTTPDLVMRQVLARHKKDGVKQLAEIVQAALASRVPSNTLVPDYVENDQHGQPDDRTSGTVTERFLRSETMGWTSTGGATATAAPVGDPFDRAMDALKLAVVAAAANVAPFRDEGPGADPLVSERFGQNGLSGAYIKDLLPQAEKVVELLKEGAYIANLRARVSAAADKAESEDS